MPEPLLVVKLVVMLVGESGRFLQALALAATAAAQVTVSVEAVAPSGVALIDENGQLQSLAIPVGVPFVQQETFRVGTHGSGVPFFLDYAETEITPPLPVGRSNCPHCRASILITHSGSGSRKSRGIWRTTLPTGASASRALLSKNFCTPIARGRRFRLAEGPG